jgi:hypothetical protein
MKRSRSHSRRMCRARKRMQPAARSLDFGQGISGSAAPQQFGIMLRELLMNAPRDRRRGTLCRGPLRQLAPAEILKLVLIHVNPAPKNDSESDSRFNIRQRACRANNLKQFP